MPGHPDGQNYAIWRASVLGSGTNVHIDSTHPITAQGQVTNYAGIEIYINQGNFNGIFLVASFYTDSTQAQFTGQKQWQLTKSQSLRCVVPALGNFVVLTMTTTDVAGGNVTYAFTPTNLAAPSTRYNGIQSVTSQTASSIAISTTIVVPTLFLAEGPAYVFMNDGAASGKILMKLIAINPDGTEGNTMFIKPVGTQTASFEFIAPDFAIGLHVQNTDAAAAHPADWYLAIDGR